MIGWLTRRSPAGRIVGHHPRRQCALVYVEPLDGAKNIGLRRGSVGRALPGDGVRGAAVDVGLEVDDQTQPGHRLTGSLLGCVDG
jgi:hypothetical protein